MVQYAGQQGWTSPIEWKMGDWRHFDQPHGKPTIYRDGGGMAPSPRPNDWWIGGNRGPGSGTLHVTPEMRPQLDAFLAYLDMNKRRGDIQDFNWGSQGQQMPWERPRYPQFPGIPGGGFPGIPGGGYPGQNTGWPGGGNVVYDFPGGDLAFDRFPSGGGPSREELMRHMYTTQGPGAVERWRSRTYGGGPRIPPWMQARTTTSQYNN